MLPIAITSLLATTPPIKVYENYNQAQNVLVSGGVSKAGTVVSLGSASAEKCSELCLAHTKRCWSYVVKEGECFAVTTPGFNPSYEEGTLSGIVEWPCRDNGDCSLNGKCTEGHCECRPAWSGHRCETLNILPTPLKAAYRGTDNGHNTSSWGGAVLKGPDDKYHMWAAEMTEHCGIGAWSQNSRVIHAVADSPSEPFVRKDVVWEVFSHEPEVVPTPDGYAMYFTAQLRSPHGLCNCCRKDHGPCDGSTGPGDCPSTGLLSDNVGNSDGTLMSYTTDINSTSWSTPVPIFPNYEGSDTNFAPFIFPNGSMVALWRQWQTNGSRMFVATASDWKDVSTYKQHHDELFPDMGAAGTEDQFMYQDEEGNFHAVFHHMYGSGTKSQWWLDATGGHAFSTNGIEWTYTGVAWGNATARYNTPEGQGAHVKFTDGTTRKFTRLERPHLIFKTNQLIGDPIYITHSAQYGNGTNPGTGAHNDDACYTIVRPIQQ